MAGELTKHQLQIIAEAVIKEQKKHEKKQQIPPKDWRLRNTKTLLKHYTWLEKHCEEIIEDIDDYEEVIFDPQELSLRALMKYKAKTKRMLDYFNSTWGSYKQYCKDKGGASLRRCQVLEKLYIIPNAMKKSELAELMNLDERTIRRDETKATQELSVFLFGIDSLSDLERMVL